MCKYIPFWAIIFMIFFFQAAELCLIFTGVEWAFLIPSGVMTVIFLGLIVAYNKQCMRDTIWVAYLMVSVLQFLAISVVLALASFVGTPNKVECDEGALTAEISGHTTQEGLFDSDK